MKVLNRAALYARVSLDQGQDTENQLAQLRQYCAKCGWEVANEYIDHATGKHSAREQFRAMFAAASRREFDVVVVWALDRFSREGVMQTFEHIKKLQSQGIQFESYTEPHFRTTGPAGELMIAVAAWIAHQERIRISDRVRAGLERARKSGTRTGKPIGRPRVVFRRDQVAELREQGLSWPRIARRVGASVRTVRRVWDAGEDSGPISDDATGTAA